jgi:predicted NBD/HSP70 family sugar kinase
MAITLSPINNAITPTQNQVTYKPSASQTTAAPQDTAVVKSTARPTLTAAETIIEETQTYSEIAKAAAAGDIQARELLAAEATQIS